MISKKNKIRVTEPLIGKEEMKNVREAVKSGWISSKGPFVEEFEEGFSGYIGMKHGIATSNGTASLHLALTALGIGRGDKVLVPSLTFISVANAVHYTGAEPVFVDSHPEYWCEDPGDLKSRIDDKTKALVVVHLYGHPSDMDEIMCTANQHGLYVIEDCAEAHGAEFKCKKVGSFGDISCFSFYGNKIITTGEGGMCLSNNEELAEKMRILRDHGMNPARKYWHDVIGFNYRMTNLQAALGVAQLNRIQHVINRKREIASQYKRFLQLDPTVIPSPEMSWAKSVYWLFSILVSASLRNELISHLERNGIESRPFFHPIHVLPPYQKGEKLRVAEELSAMGTNLPSGPQLEKDQIREISESILSFISRSGARTEEAGVAPGFPS